MNNTVIPIGPNLAEQIIGSDGLGMGISNLGEELSYSLDLYVFILSYYQFEGITSF
jgi:hypothetical protein